ncbi:class I SAM-dependent methyltransferase [Patescibacteria group bacterium]|nr:class I SAM-dependent methyltransferase [Patescibacteria group bacterium]
MKSVVNENSEVYYSEMYWNDIPQVLRYMNKNFTKSEQTTWQSDFKKRFAKKPFEHALVLNCGNGWVEREFIDKKIITKATAFDYSTDLLAQAKKQKKGRNITYTQIDANKTNFNENEYDLIINVAALHHVQFINRMSLQIAKALKPNGILVSFDYIGPGRNQYPKKQWTLANKINNSLPESIKHDSLYYPHLPTMMVTDPTEGIHANLIIPNLKKYFKILEQNDTNGSIAYLLLTHNKKVSKLKNPEKFKLIKKIIDEDKKLTKSENLPIMFSYFIAKPNKKIISNNFRNQYFQLTENIREYLSGIFLGAYGPKQFFVIASNRYYHLLKNKLRHLKNSIGI